MSTHYMAGGMPLAFTQEDFLVSLHGYTKFNMGIFGAPKRRLES